MCSRIDMQTNAGRIQVLIAPVATW